jgi:DNA-nicking Smr family endonuclease
MSDSHDDQHLFRQAMRAVRRLSQQKALHATPKPLPQARFRRADEQAVLRESLQPDPATVATGDEISFQRPGVSAAIVRKLRGGGFAVGAELDLHGLREAECHPVLRDFIADALGSNLRCVRIIHGKGRRSGPRGPVLKNLVNSWLRKIDVVVAFVSARPVDGGTGAVYVLLKSASGK